MAASEALRVTYTDVQQDRIAATASALTAFKSVRLKEPFRTPSPSVLSFFLSLAVFATLPTAVGLALKKFVPDAPDYVLKGYAIGMVVGCVTAAVYLAVQTLFQTLQRAARARAIETLLMQANGGVNVKDLPGTATFDAAGLRFESGDDTLFFPWPRLSAFVEHQDTYVFVFRNAFAMPLPKAPLSDDQRRRLVSCVERWAPGVGPMPMPPRDSGLDRAPAA